MVVPTGNQSIGRWPEIGRDSIKCSVYRNQSIILLLTHSFDSIIAPEYQPEDLAQPCGQEPGTGRLSEDLYIYLFSPANRLLLLAHWPVIY